MKITNNLLCIYHIIEELTKFFNKEFKEICRKRTMEYHQKEIDKHILTLTVLSLMHQKWLITNSDSCSKKIKDNPYYPTLMVESVKHRCCSLKMTSEGIISKQVLGKSNPSNLKLENETNDNSLYLSFSIQFSAPLVRIVTRGDKPTQLEVS